MYIEVYEYMSVHLCKIMMIARKNEKLQFSRKINKM